MSAEKEGAPLILDLDGDGVEFSYFTGTGAAPIYWDIDSDGFREASAWVGADDGLLTIDLNANGIVDGHNELFGTLDTDGFDILANYDTNSDGVINASDTQFSDLKVWQDANQDGISQAEELTTLTERGITSISLATTSTPNDEIAGNPISTRSTYTLAAANDNAEKEKSRRAA